MYMRVVLGGVITQFSHIEDWKRHEARVRTDEIQRIRRFMSQTPLSTILCLNMGSCE